MNIVLDGQVALVTGAGQGLGEVYAKRLAELGAVVVVNDIAKNDAGISKAVIVSNLINEADGISIPNTDSVADYDAVKSMISGIIAKYGRLDIVIHNAGIVTNRLIEDYSLDEWNECIDVNLNAAFYLVKEACPHMKRQNYGRIIFITSSAGMYGMKEEGAYAAGKMGLWGLARTIHQEASQYNIMCNVISPLANSQMVSDIVDQEILNIFSKEKVAAVATVLCSPHIMNGGRIYQAAGGYISRMEICQSKGVMLNSQFITSNMVIENMDEINDMKEAVPVLSIAQAGRLLLKKVRKSVK